MILDIGMNNLTLKNLLEDFELFDRYLAVKERRNGQSYIKVISLESGLEKMLEFDESVYVVELDDNLDFSP